MPAKLPKSRTKAVTVGRKKTRNPDTEYYSGRIAARLSELRAAKGWTAEELAARLSAIGRDVPVSNLFAYEAGRKAGGTDLPTDLIPAIANVYGFSTASGWLPKR